VEAQVRRRVEGGPLRVRVPQHLPPVLRTLATVTRDLFRVLYDEATALAVDVFEHGHADHPCAYLVRDAYADANGEVPHGWPGTWRQHWQMPETYWGEIERDPPVAFVGINPSIEVAQACPRHGASFDAWFDFYRNRIGPRGVLRGITSSAPPLYGFYSSAVRRALGDEADVHTHALICDAVHYKSRKPGDNKERLRAAIDHATSAPLSLALIRHAGCRVVVLAGQHAIEALAPALGVEEMPHAMSDIVGRWFEGENGLRIVPSYHSWSLRNASVIGRAIAFALRGEPINVVHQPAHDRITEADVLALMEERGLSVTRERKAWRVVDGRFGRRVCWQRHARGLPTWIEFGGFTIPHVAVRPVAGNGRIEGRIDCATVERSVAIEILARAFDAL